MVITVKSRVALGGGFEIGGQIARKIDRRIERSRDSRIAKP